MKLPSGFRIGTAGWQLPKAFRELFPAEGSQLERYAARLNGVEVNSTFYRLPRLATAERWAASVPPEFRFALKLPKRITHEQRLRNAARPMKEFMRVAAAFGDRLGPVLVQLPPRQGFTVVAEDFLTLLHEQDLPGIALEARHASWFTSDVNALLKRSGIARVAADPPRAPGDGSPAGYGELAYFRLHGSPRIYWSDYDEQAMRTWARTIRRASRTAKETWVIFDNTALGAATGNALSLRDMLQSPT